LCNFFARVRVLRRPATYLCFEKYAFFIFLTSALSNTRATQFGMDIRAILALIPAGILHYDRPSRTANWLIKGICGKRYSLRSFIYPCNYTNLSLRARLWWTFI